MAQFLKNAAVEALGIALLVVLGLAKVFSLIAFIAFVKWIWLRF